MKTILEVLTLSADYLSKKGIANSRREAEDLMSDALDLNRMDLYLKFEQPMSEDELQICRQNLTRRGKNEPLQYIKGEVDFYGCKIRVTPDVLIPRQETEILVDMIAKRLEEDQKREGSLKGKVLFDVCTGSGCIGISLKKKFPDLKVLLSDISVKALDVAKENAKKAEVDVEFFVGDLLQPFQGKKCDYFVCNPPYIAEKEYGTLPPEVKNYEPRQALISGATGLEFYERLANELQGFMKTQAAGFFEIGTTQGKHILNLFGAEPWKNVKFLNDWSSHDRFFFLEIE